MSDGYGIPPDETLGMLGDAHWTNYAENREFFLNQNNPTNFERTYNTAFLLYKAVGQVSQKVDFDQIMGQDASFSTDRTFSPGWRSNTPEKITSDNDIPDVVMVYFEDHYIFTPVPVREEIIDRFAHRYSLDKSRLRRAASRSASAEAKVAAFRKSPYPPGVPSFVEQIERSSLPKRVKEYWLDLAKRGDPDEKT